MVSDPGFFAGYFIFCSPPLHIVIDGINRISHVAFIDPFPHRETFRVAVIEDADGVFRDFQRVTVSKTKQAERRIDQQTGNPPAIAFAAVNKMFARINPADFFLSVPPGHDGPGFFPPPLRIRKQDIRRLLHMD